MLTEIENQADHGDTTVLPVNSHPQTATKTGRISRALRIEWLGQTVASLCWIVSVFVYGINDTGDWLQLAAASAWLLANISTLFESEAD